MRKLLAKIFPSRDFRSDEETFRQLRKQLAEHPFDERPLLLPPGWKYQRIRSETESSIEALARMVA